MVKFLFILLVPLFVPHAVLAHQINGTLQNARGSALQNTRIDIRCPSTQKTTRTDKRGSFSFYISKTGRCMIVVKGATYKVYSSKNPVRYDLIFDKGRLRRR